MSRDRCRIVDVAGVQVSIRGGREPNAEDLAALAKIVEAVLAADAKLSDEERAERAARQQAGRDRNRARNERLGL